MGNLNGSGGNGHDKETEGSPEASNVARFPSEHERREIEKARAAATEAANRARRPQSEPVFNLPRITKMACLVLIVAQVVISALDFFMPALRDTIFLAGAFIPARYTGGMEPGWQALTSPFTHMLLHGGWLHLGLNVATLAAFGAGLEKDFGGRKFLLLFFATGLAGALAHFALYPEALNPLIGASGGISGLFGGVLMMAHTRGMMQGGKSMLLPFIAIWIGISLFFGYFGMPCAEGEVAWTTHIGGFVAGLLLYKPLIRLKI